MSTDVRIPEEERARLLAEAQAAIDVTTIERRVTIERPPARTEGTTTVIPGPRVAVTFHHPLLIREDGAAWSCGNARGSEALARRLAAAIEAGAVLETPEVGVDVYGDTYVHARSRILGRTMNADLRRLGF